MKKVFAAALAALMLLSLCACGEVPPCQISIEANGGTGYQWTCQIADPAVASVSDTVDAGNGTPGAKLSYLFTFTGVASGTTVATFSFGRSFEPETVLTRTCELSVDEKLAVTASPLSQSVLTITPGSADYLPLMMNSGVFSLQQDSETGVCTVSALMQGESRLDLFYMGEDASATDKVYLLNADAQGTIGWMAQEQPDTGFAEYESAEELASATGLKIPHTAKTKKAQYTQVGELAYMSFLWEESELFFVTGFSDMEELIDESSLLESVGEITVYYTVGDTLTSVAWENGGVWSYVAGENDAMAAEVWMAVVPELFAAQI